MKSVTNVTTITAWRRLFVVSMILLTNTVVEGYVPLSKLTFSKRGGYGSITNLKTTVLSASSDGNEGYFDKLSAENPTRSASVELQVASDAYAVPVGVPEKKWVDLDKPSLEMGRSLILLASALYGSNFALVKELNAEMPVSISAALRFVLAAVVFGGMVLSNEASKQKQDLVMQGDYDEIVPRTLEQEERNKAFLAGLEIGVYYCVAYICQAEGLATMAAGKSAFFNALAVVVVPLLDAAFRGRSLKPTAVLSVALSCFGVGLLELGPSGDLSFGVGDYWALGQTLLFGLGYWRLETHSQRHRSQAGRLTLGQLVAVAVGATVFCAADIYTTGGASMPNMEEWVGWLTSPFVVFGIFWTGLISTALALYLETVASKVVSASELTLLMTSVSLWGAGFAYLLSDEVLSQIGMVGGLLILSGCILNGLVDDKGVEEVVSLSDDSTTDLSMINDSQLVDSTNSIFLYDDDEESKTDEYFQGVQPR